MTQTQTGQVIPQIDERFFSEWYSWGLKELEAYLKKHLAFARYCEARDA